VHEHEQNQCCDRADPFGPHAQVFSGYLNPTARTLRFTVGRRLWALARRLLLPLAVRSVALANQVTRSGTEQMPVNQAQPRCV